MIKPFHSQVLTEVHNLLETLTPNSIPVRQAEVPLLLIFNMIQSITVQEREKPKPDNPYLYLVGMLTKIDFLAYDCHLITNCYLETLVRYSFYFNNNEEFFRFLIDNFFSGQAILGKQKSVTSHAAYQLCRLCELMQFKPAFIKHVDTLVAKSIEVIIAYESSKISEEVFGHDEVNYLYNILGLQACNSSYIDQGKRLKILQWAI